MFVNYAGLGGFSTLFFGVRGVRKIWPTPVTKNGFAERKLRLPNRHLARATRKNYPRKYLLQAVRAIALPFLGSLFRGRGPKDGNGTCGVTSKGNG